MSVTTDSTVSPLSMSDDDILGLEFPDDVGAEEPDTTEGGENDYEQAEDTQVQEQDEETEEGTDISEEPDEDDSEESETEEGETEELEEEGEEVIDDPVMDYEAVFKPFKANGREMQVDNPEDAIRLMQMGANYNAKMRDLKPNIKMLKSLEDNGIKDQDQINFLIDLSKRDPAAISKLMNDGEMDPLDLDMDAEYTANTYETDDATMELTAVVDEIQDSEHYGQLQTVVTEEWDGRSRDVIYDNPTLLKTLNNHMEAGIYDQIANIVVKEQALGRLTDLSSIDAYKHVGDELQRLGAFSQGGNPPEAASNSNPVQQSDQAARQKKRKAASPSKKARKTPPKTFNPLSMSDEEIMALGDDFLS